MSFINYYDFGGLKGIFIEEADETTQGEMVLHSVVASLMHLIESMIYPSSDSKVK